MLEILKTLRDGTAHTVMATLVRVRGSSFRKAGARMLIGPDRWQLGAVSAGCLEADLLEHGREVLESGKAKTVSYAMGAELDQVWGTGMGCAGSVEILLERMPAGGLPPWGHFCLQKLEARKTCVLVTVLSSTGGGCHPGDRFAFDDRGHGLLPMDQELSVILHRASQAALHDGKLMEGGYELQAARVEVLVEALRPAPLLSIFGAGELSRILSNLALLAGWQVRVSDHRSGLLNRERFPGAQELCLVTPHGNEASRGLDDRSAAVVLSHVFEQDRKVLSDFLESRAPYVGLLGSQSRAAKLLDAMATGGFVWKDDMLARYYHPVGLDIGSGTPESIALSILAEAEAVLNGRSGGHLRDRDRSRAMEGGGAVHG